MNKENRKYWIGLMLCVILLTIVVVDYIFCKKIPDFVFLGDFKKDNVESYWQGVIAIFTICMTWLTVRQTADSYFFEKYSYRQMQKKEAVRHYQELLKEAIDIFNNRHDNESASLLAVYIVKNIMDLMIRVKKGERTEDEIEPYQIISIDGALGILKSHFDQVLSAERNCESKRQDIELIIDILYKSRYFKWNRRHLHDLKLYSFKNLFIDISYFDGVVLENADFHKVKFMGDEGNYIWGMTSTCKFSECIFKNDFRFWWDDYCSVEIAGCEFQGLNVLAKDEIEYKGKKGNGKKRLYICDCTFKGYSNFSNNQFVSLQISKCRFDAMLHMHELEVESEFSVRDTVFLEGLDFQRSRIRHKLLFMNTICKKLFYFGDSCLLNKNKIVFINFYTDNFEDWNLSVDVYDHPNKELDMEKKQVFGNLYEVVWNVEKGLYTLVSKKSD